MPSSTVSRSRRTALPQRTRHALPLTGDFQLVPGFNLNGIDATPDGKTLVVVQSATGKLFTVDAATGVTKEIGLGGATLPNGDGLLLHGRTLYVVQNQLNRIAVVSLAKGSPRGSSRGRSPMRTSTCRPRSTGSGSGSTRSTRASARRRGRRRRTRSVQVLPLDARRSTRSGALPRAGRRDARIAGASVASERDGVDRDEDHERD